MKYSQGQKRSHEGGTRSQEDIFVGRKAFLDARVASLG